jgi:predicted nuclease of restriction endonuclease-like (RecB) superfamily
VSALRSQSGWTHFGLIIALDNPLQRAFYAEMCRVERASGIRVASYWTEALPTEQLERKLHEAVRLARGEAASVSGRSRHEAKGG